ncbi:MAG: hypothetical protein JWO38_151 [Gemmataceae bacterium]|nr:hypothetical protein [Gemmataceae bacterium]
MGSLLRSRRRFLAVAATLLFPGAGGQAQPPPVVPPGEQFSLPAAVPPSGANDGSAPATSRPPIGGARESRLGPGQEAVAGSIPTAQAGTPEYKLLRYQEDWSSLKDPAKRTDFWDPLKYIPLGTRDGYYLTLGGDVREWFESYHNDSFGLGPGNAQGYNTYFLQRYMLYGDLHLGPNVRVFTQTINGFEDGRIGGPRPDIDRNQFDLHQGFLDWRWALGDTDSVTWRLGRQEFEYGTGRLIDVREGPNLRLSFDAARALTKIGDWAVDGWWAKPVRNNPGTFDDDPNPAVSFWGVYGVRPVGDGSKLTVDVYYLGFENKQASFDQRSGYELRHSIGTRIWGRPKPLEYNLEYVYQFGTFGGGRISAWTAANAVRYTLEDLPLKPRPGVRFDVASGNRDAASPNLQTFNPLFPAGAYFNLAGPFGPLNIIDLHPTLDLTLTDKLTLSADWNFFWRESLGDGVYLLSGALLASGLKSGARYIGSSPAATVVWNPARHVTVLTSYVHVFPGPFLKDATPGKPVDFVTTWLTYRF